MRGIIPVGRPTGRRVLTHDFLALLHKGTAIFEDANGGIRSIGPGTAIFCPAGMWHRYDFAPEPVWENYWIMFDVAIATERFGKLTPATCCCRRIANSQSMLNAWSEMEAMRFQLPSSPETGSFLLHQLLFTFWRQRVGDRSLSKGGFPFLDESIRFLNENIQQRTVDVHSLARKLGMAYPTFRARFRKATGMAPNQYLIDMKIRAAQSLLIDPGYRISEIAEQLGFRDPFYFSRIFKTKTGQSPAAYRANAFGTVPIEK